MTFTEIYTEFKNEVWCLELEYFDKLCAKGLNPVEAQKQIDRLIGRPEMEDLYYDE